ncbi:MAG TPA: tripartite tricarboxylate transporter TctB family protein, partial [Oxalicibacterium sp.]
MSQQKEQKEAVLVKRAAAELACALLFFAIGGVVIWSSLEIGSGWGPRGPQSGYFPLRIGIILCVAALGVAVEAWRTKRASGNAESFVTRAELKPVLQVLLPIVLFVVVTDYLGIYV